MRYRLKDYHFWMVSVILSDNDNVAVSKRISKTREELLQRLEIIYPTGIDFKIKEITKQEYFNYHQ